MFIYKDEVPRCEVRDGNMAIEWSDGNSLCIPLRIFRQNMAVAQAAIDRYEAAKVEPIMLYRLSG